MPNQTIKRPETRPPAVDGKVEHSATASLKCCLHFPFERLGKGQARTEHRPPAMVAGVALTASPSCLPFPTFWVRFSFSQQTPFRGTMRLGGDGQDQSGFVVTSSFASLTSHVSFRRRSTLVVASAAAEKSGAPTRPPANRFPPRVPVWLGAAGPRFHDTPGKSTRAVLPTVRGSRRIAASREAGRMPLGAPWDGC